jgi:protein gp37
VIVAENSAIEWTDATWNPIVGCSVVTPGCTNCYAMRLAGTRLKHHPSRAGLTIDTKAGPVWNGEVRLIDAWLDQPIHWKRPRRIFVCAHGDLFHESVSDAWIDRVFAGMALAPHHTFQVLTKRDERMHAYIVARMDRRDDGEGFSRSWPLPNVWLGVSVEDRARKWRIDKLRDTPAALRFLSLEPLLGDLGDINLSGIGWTIVGGESGPHARPMSAEWARSLRDQCKAAGVAFFMKQMSKKAPIPDDLLVREFPA